jgi:hypothetical protein
MNCWDFLKCAEETYKSCPAYPDKGLDCWKVTGTKCDQGKMEKASLQEKVVHCRTCDFYKEYAHKF